jgi:thiazole synthase
MELGYDGILVNTAVAKATDPVLMAEGFADGITAGRKGYLAGVIEPQSSARASTPLLDKPLWHQKI